MLEGRIKELQILAESTEKLRARLEEIASEKLDALLAEKCHRVYRELGMMVKVDKDGEVAAESPVSSFCKSRNAC